MSQAVIDLAPVSPVDNTRQVTLLYSGELSSADRGLVKLGEFLGTQISVESLPEIFGNPERLGTAAGRLIFARAEVLVRWLDSAPEAERKLRDWLGGAGTAFIYGFQNGAGHDRLVRAVSAGQLTAVEPASAGSPFAVMGDRSLGGALTGLTVGSADPATDFVFRAGENAKSVTPVIQVDGRPFLARIAVGDGQVYLSGSGAVVDLDRLVTLDESGLRFFSSFVPFVMVLRRVLGTAAWHTYAPQGCFIIDDPPLKLRYGCLDYRKLTDALDHEDGSASIAFIPWNYRRSDQRAVEIFQRYPNRLSLCVHGCDHTAGEFGFGAEEILVRQSRRALARMVEHERFAGLPFDPVMVFPQGIFSTAAMRALKDSGYLAAINSTLEPIDATDTRVPLKELLEPALSRFAGLPLFVRRYPHALDELAFDLFVGKPALLVEHHRFFRDGYDRLVETIRRVRQFEPRLRWSSPAKVCSRTCLKRAVAGGVTHLRYYCDRFEFQAPGCVPQKYVLSPNGVSTPYQPVVAVNGKPSEYAMDTRGLNLTRPLLPGDRLAVQFQTGTPVMAPELNGGRYLRRAGVFLRRHLCEFRDNYLQSN